LSSDVRLAAVKALTVVGSASAIEPLKALAKDEHPQVRLYAERGIKRISR
jgi:HEAT repeat protein